jgi:hypothetical protein
MSRYDGRCAHGAKAPVTRWGRGRWPEARATEARAKSGEAAVTDAWRASVAIKAPTGGRREL